MCWFSLFLLQKSSGDEDPYLMADLCGAGQLRAVLCVCFFGIRVVLFFFLFFFPQFLLLPFKVLAKDLELNSALM